MAKCISRRQSLECSSSTATGHYKHHLQPAWLHVCTQTPGFRISVCLVCLSACLSVSVCLGLSLPLCLPPPSFSLPLSSSLPKGQYFCMLSQKAVQAIIFLTLPYKAIRYLTGSLCPLESARRQVRHLYIVKKMHKKITYFGFIQITRDGLSAHFQNLPSDSPFGSCQCVL